MKILMVTNTFTPHVGGVARSVQQFTAAYRNRGHRVLVIAPSFAGAPAREPAVLRIPAVQQFNGTDFSVPVPVPGFVWQRVKSFAPDIVHSHHPFLLGDTALRIATAHHAPVVFTHHTQYEQYTHYVPGDSPAMKRFVVDLAVGYCNLCDAVIAPSDTIRHRLQRLGVTQPVHAIPTGVDVPRFAAGRGQRARAAWRIPASAFVVGHVGRLAPEKGLDFLAGAVADFLAPRSGARFLVVGSGPSTAALRAACESRGVSQQLILTGKLQGADLADAYAAMDIFAFASQSETQGMVLTEAMAASVPVVAVDAPGVREVVVNGENGRLLGQEDHALFVDALAEIYASTRAQRDRLVAGALATAQAWSLPSTADKALAAYQSLLGADRGERGDRELWTQARRRLAEEWKIWSNVASAAYEAVTGAEAVGGLSQQDSDRAAER